MDLPQEVPVMTLPQTVLFPNALLPLYIFEPRYRQMLRDTLAGHRLFAVAMQRPGWSRESPCPVAGLGLIRAAVDRPDGTSNLVLQGIARVELTAVVRYKPYRIHRIAWRHPSPPNPVTLAPLTSRVLHLVSRRLQQGLELPPPILAKLRQITAPASPPSHGHPGEPDAPGRENGPDLIADLVSCTLLSSATNRQTLLETWDVEARLRHLIHFLTAEIEQQEKGNT